MPDIDTSALGRIDNVNIAPRLAYSIPQAVHSSGISRSVLYTYIKSRQLPIVKVGQHTLIRHTDLVQFLDDRLIA